MVMNVTLRQILKGNKISLGDLNARLFELANLNHVVTVQVINYKNYEALYLDNIKSNIFHFPPDEALKWIEMTLSKINQLNESGYSLVEQVGFSHANSLRRLTPEQIDVERDKYYKRSKTNY